jgi:bifunctional DNase/RNase
MIMMKMQVEGIGIDQQNNPLVLLCDEEHKTFVPIWIGPAEAMSIQMELDSRQPPRPMTHDLMTNILYQMNVRLLKVTVNDFERQVYYATLHLESKHGVQEVDARPSDAIALALRTQCEIWVSNEVIEKAGIQREDVISEVEGETEDADMSDFNDLSDLPSRAEDVAPASSPEEINKFVRLLEGVEFGENDGDKSQN